MKILNLMSYIYARESFSKVIWWFDPFHTAVPSSCEVSSVAHASLTFSVVKESVASRCHAIHVSLLFNRCMRRVIIYRRMGFAFCTNLSMYEYRSLLTPMKIENVLTWNLSSFDITPFGNLGTYWPSSGIIYRNPNILHVCLILSEFKQICGVAISFSVRTRTHTHKQAHTYIQE